MRYVLAGLLLVCCSGSPREKLEKKLTYLRQVLTHRDCPEAERIIQDLGGGHERNSEYISLKASGEACRGNYDEVRFFGEDVSSLSGATQGGFFYSLASFENSQDAPGSVPYTALDNAIRTLLYAGGEPEHTARVARFGREEADELNTQLFYMVITQLGRYVRFYGNMGDDGSGVLSKGSGDGINSCFADYTTPVAMTLLAGLPGTNPCAVAGDSHLSMRASVTGRKAVMCEGIVLFNVLLELIVEIAFIGRNTESLRDLQAALIAVGCSGVLVGAPVCQVKSHQVCEDLPEEQLEALMIAYFEFLTGV